MKKSITKYSLSIFYILFLLLGMVGVLTQSCKKDEEVINNQGSKYGNATPYKFNLPNSLRNLPTFIPTDNPMTEEGVALGRFLFYDSILSADNSISCGSCHKQENAFSNAPYQFSKGILGQFGTKNSMNLFNLVFQKGPLFWDGRSKSLEDQIIHPVLDRVEMANTWEVVIERFSVNVKYMSLYKVVFQSEIVTKENLAKSIAQFLRTIISGNSRFDRFNLTAEENAGRNIFFLPPKFDDRLPIRIGGGLDCAHCHNVPLFQPEKLLPDFMNNGMGGKFRVPSLRNVTMTGPYMHNGSLTNLDSVIAHYEFVKPSPDLDPNMWIIAHVDADKRDKALLKISPKEYGQIKAFLATLKDDSLFVKKEYSNPFRK